MTTHAAWDLQQAVFDALVADPDLVAALGGTFVYDAVPPNTDAPYVHLSEVSARDWSTATEAGAEVAFHRHRLVAPGRPPRGAGHRRPCPGRAS